MMAEIPRDKLEINTIKTNKPVFKGKQEEKPVPCNKEKEEVSQDSLRNHPGEVLGRSQVKFNKLSFNGEMAENLKKDLAFLGENFEQINKSEKIYNVVYDKAVKDGNPDPYKTATQVQLEYIQEMGKE
jgi:hypothetical protein